MFHCYVLSSEKTGRRYVGSCENLADRIDRSFASRSEAAQRERYYKTGRGRDELNKPR